MKLKLLVMGFSIFLCDAIVFASAIRPGPTPPAAPGQPRTPTGPVQPRPGQPTTPVRPGRPVSTPPATPVQPRTPTGPVQPRAGQPTTPVGPRIPGRPVSTPPATPAQPRTPTGPVQPRPGQPTTPVRPGRPGPTPPATPVQPRTPTVPAQPRPGQPRTPVRPGGPERRPRHPINRTSWVADIAPLAVIAASSYIPVRDTVVEAKAPIVSVEPEYYTYYPRTERAYDDGSWRGYQWGPLRIGEMYRGIVDEKYLRATDYDSCWTNQKNQLICYLDGNWYHAYEQ